MSLFTHRNRTKSERSRRTYAAFEIADTVIAFLAAICFLIGSVMFMYDDWHGVARWLFVAGSGFFCLKPTLRLVREIRLASMGDTDHLAKRFTV
ncbi:YrhK family protein [Roseovarius sp.]|uniref:YrhK family protein n=1 Tax=Roseovarius sp. TaxID=1486281 RepID=UPI003510F310